MSESTDLLDQLLAVPPGQFVAERNRLVATLKKTDPRQAATIKGLTRPSASVWATNQVARTAPAALTAYLNASDALEQAQSGTGGSEESRRAYQSALARQREALDQAVEVARAALTAAALSTTRAVLERVTNNLRWAVPGSEPRRLLEGGRLLADLDPPDFSTLVDRIAIAPPSARPPRPCEPPKGSPTGESGAPRPRDPGRRVETLRARRAAIEETIAAARLQVDRARTARDEAERTATSLRRDLAAAEKAAADAERAHVAARDTLERQLAQLDQVAVALAAAEAGEARKPE